MKQLKFIQSELKAPKGQFNKFGGYKYRSCEDILEAVKPLLAKYGCTLTISDEIVLIGDRFYVKATSKITDVENGEFEECVAFAREEEAQKGMSSAQLTGSTSSYARKYSLNGLLCIDDNSDDDTRSAEDNEPKKKEKKPATKEKVQVGGLSNRDKVIETAKQRGIAMTDLAQQYNLDRNTTEERYAEVLEDMGA